MTGFDGFSAKKLELSNVIHFGLKIRALANLKIGAFAALRDFSIYPTQSRQEAKLKKSNIIPIISPYIA